MRTSRVATVSAAPAKPVLLVQTATWDGPRRRLRWWRSVSDQPMSSPTQLASRGRAHPVLCGNPDTAADPNWTPLFNPALPVATAGIGPALITPPYPDHVSGATTYASMHAFASFFGTDEMGVPFYLTSSRFPIDPALPREQRFFTRFADVTNEILEAPIWAGIHFRNADVQAAQFGSEVEHHIHQHLFASQ